jgi:hypothetical protein
LRHKIEPVTESLYVQNFMLGATER